MLSPEHEAHVLAEVVDVDGSIDEPDARCCSGSPDLQVGVPALGRVRPERAEDVPQREVVGTGRQFASIEPVFHADLVGVIHVTVAVVVGSIVRVRLGGAEEVAPPALALAASEHA